MNTQPSATTPVPDLPEGTVTFLFTDIEGSTKLLERLREQYAVLLDEQRCILRDAFARIVPIRKSRIASHWWNLIPGRPSLK